jgi:IPT/TIG domain
VRKGGDGRESSHLGWQSKLFDVESEDDAMSLKKRHTGRRVAGVGLGVALMVLGLQAPAFAAPTVTSFTPTTGPTDCVIALTGTGFTDVPKVDQDVVFVGPVAGPADDIVLDGATPAQADLFARIGSTEMWVQIPATLSLGVGYNLRVDGGGTGTASATTFTRVDGAGGCAPTITKVTPNCGTTDTVVTITGTNLIGPGLGGADTRFAPYTVSAAHSVPDVDLTTSLSVVVPSVSANALVDGLIRVTTFGTSGGTVFSPSPPFDISDNCAPTTGTEHARAITFKLKKSGAASGVVSSTEEEPFTGCVSEVPVKFKFKPKGKSWKNAGSTTTDDQGSYKKKLKGKPGKYKAIAAKVGIGDPVTDTCLKAVSAVRTIKK